MKINSGLKSGSAGLKALLIVLIFAGLALSQDRSQVTSFTNEAKNFEFSVSSDYLVDRENETVRVYNYSGPASIMVLTEKMRKPKGYVKGLKYPNDKSTNREKFEFDDFVIRTFEYDLDGSFSTSIFVASSDDYFLISASASRKDDSALVRFLQSIRINGRPVFANMLTVAEKNANPLVLTQPAVSQLVLDAVSRPHNTTTKVQFDGVKKEAVGYDSSYSRGLIVLRKTQASYTDAARQNNRQGTIRTKVEFLKDGQIGNITVDPSLDRGLAANVARVVKQLKFIPAEINGKPVDVTRLVEYNFSIY